MKQSSCALTEKYPLIPAPMKQFSCALTEKYPLIPAPMKQFSCALTEKYPLIPAPMKQLICAFTQKYTLIPAPMKQLSCAFIEKYPLIPAPMKQFIFLAATACAFQYPNKYSLISHKSKIFCAFSELSLTFYSICDIVYISTKKYSGRRIYLPPQLLSNVTDAFALQG